MEFEQAVKARRSVRNFSQKDVPDSLVEELIECAMMAPSSMNGQPWCFIVVRKAETKRRIAETKDRYCPPEKREYPAGFLCDAPVVVVTCIDRAKAYDRGIESGVLATANLLLAAADRGLSAVYMSAYKDGTPGVADEIRGILAIPGSVDPVTIVPMGYPGEPAKPKSLVAAEEVVFHEAFGARKGGSR